MTIEDFLQTLRERELVPESVLAQVQTKVSQGDRRITAKSLLKYLVKKELVSRGQARELLETTITVSPNAESSILGIAATPRVMPRQTPQSDSLANRNENLEQLAPEEVDDIPTVRPVDDGPGSLVTDDAMPIGSSADLFGQKPSSLISESISQIGTSVDATLSEAIDEGNEQTERAEKPRGRKKKVKKNEWDSSLLLLGGGGLILLVMTGVIIFYLLTRENADAVLAEASAFYDGGSYTQAIKQYTRFVENHSQHPEISTARVKLGLARLWKASSTSGNSVVAFDTARDVLRQIEDEEEFASAQTTLADLLPKIAAGIADQAEGAAQPEEVQPLLDKAGAALSLCANTKYIPKRFRDEVQLNEIRETLARVERSKAENAALAKALAAMQAAIGANNTAEAYRLYDQVIEDHPGLVNNEQLAESIASISAAESEAVRFVADQVTGMVEEAPNPVIAELTLAHQSGVPADGEGVVLLRASGALYALNSATGELLWRRFVGVAPELTPVSMPTGEVLIVDAQRRELLKLRPQDGKLLWRQALKTNVARPVVLGDRILLTELAGRLHVIDASTGERTGYVEFGQGLSTEPLVDVEAGLLYMVGEHSSLYTLSADDFSCLGVYFLGHVKGSVHVPPRKVLNKLFVAVSKGVSTTELNVLDLATDGNVAQHVATRRLSGLIDTALLARGRRLVALSSLGEVVVYEVGTGEGKSALTQLAAREQESGPMVARFGYVDNRHVWVAGPRLSKMAILPTSDRLSVTNIDRDYAGDTFDHPLRADGELLIHLRRPAAMAGVAIAAMDRASGTTRWETEIAAPLAGAPVIDAATSRINAVTSTGAVYVLDREAMRRRIAKQSEEPRFANKLPPLANGLDLGEGRVVASPSQGKSLLHFNPQAGRPTAKAIPLPGAISGSPVVWGDGFVVPTQVGQVFLHSSEDGKQIGAPFQPSLQPGVTYKWLTPAVYEAGDRSMLVISDGQASVYLVERVAGPQPHLAEAAAAELSTPLDSRLAVLGDHVFGGATDGTVVALELPALTVKERIEIGSQVTWGPFVAGDQLILGTSSEQVIAVSADQKLLWRQSLAHGPLAGKPLATDEGLLVLWQQGGISRIDPSTGDELAYVPLPQPVVEGPVAFGRRLLVSSYDGTLLVLNRPQ